MKRPLSWLLMLPALLFGSACKAPSDQSIIVTTARAPGTQCDFSDSTKYVEGGAIDLAAFGADSSYLQVFSWENDLENISVTVTSQITTDTPNTFIATTIEDSYVLLGGGAKPPAGLVSITAAIAPGAVASTSDVGVFLLTQQAMATICGAPSATENCPGFPAGTSSATLNVTFQIAGALVGGGSAQTNAITFPLTLFNSWIHRPRRPSLPDRRALGLCAGSESCGDGCGSPAATSPTARLFPRAVPCPFSPI